MDINQSSNSIYGVAQGVSYGQNERVDELNTRIAERQIADQPLKPQFDIRAVSTKYALFPIVDRRTQAKVPHKEYLDHSVETNFCPNISRGPAIEFSRNVDTESALRSQFFALQHGAYQGVYVPSSGSDLYKVGVYGRQCEQPHNFSQFTFDQAAHPNVSNAQHVGKDTFWNNTRTQLRGSNDKK